MNKKFSVIVANYNNGRYLIDLIQSLKNQTYSNWELVIADDASSDDSIYIIKKFIESDDRIKLVAHKKNSGAGAAFKSAMDNSTGDIIGMLGADDALLPETLQVMMTAHIESPDTSIINSQAFDCDENLNNIGLCSISGKQPSGVSFIHEIHVCNFVTFKRSAYHKTQGFNPLFQRAVDHDLFLKLEEVGNVGFVAKPLYLYRRHEGGISQGNNGKKAATFSLLAHMDAFKRRKKSGFQPNLTEKEYRAKALVYHQRMALQLRLQKNYSQSIWFNWQCLKFSSSYIGNPSFWSSIFYNLKGMLLHS